MPAQICVALSKLLRLQMLGSNTSNVTAFNTSDCGY